MVTANAVEARYYDDDIGLVNVFGKTKYDHHAGLTTLKDERIL